MSKIKPRYLVLATAIMLSFILPGCQESPSNAVVIGKNDGKFEENIMISAPDSQASSVTTGTELSEIFYSTDNSVEFNVDIVDTPQCPNMPVLEVAPHYLTGDEAKRVAYTLFGDVTFWEWQHWSDESLSKEEIQSKVSRWSEFTSQEAIDALWGTNQVDSVPVVKKFIEEYTEKLSTAQNQNNKVPCQWTFRKAPFYLFSTAEATQYQSDKEDDMLKATTNVSGIPFTLQFGTRNQNDYKANYIRVYIDSDSPLGIDKRYFTAQLCRTEKPTPEQVEKILSQTVEVLDDLGLGTWTVDKCEIVKKFYGDIAEYMIDVRAVPMLNGIPTIYQAPISNLTADDVYASNYQMSSIQIQFSPNGQLIYFSMDSPVDIEETINSNVAVIPTDELLDLAKTNLMLSTFSQYDIGAQISPSSQNIICKVTISKVTYALARIRKPNTDTSYYYIPALTIYGDAGFYNKATGDFYFSNDDLTLLSLNAVDGSIVNSTNS